MMWAQELSLAELAEGGHFSDGDWVESKDQDPAGAVRLTQLADVGAASFRNRSDRWLRDDQAARLGCTFLEPDDILIARMPDPIGRACLVPQNIGRAVTVVDVAILRIKRGDVDPRYAMWAMNAPVFHREVVRLQSGTTRKRISRKNLATLRIPVPPLDDQRRIVTLLEDHLSRLDAAVTQIHHAETQSTVMLRSALNHGLRAVLVDDDLSEGSARNLFPGVPPLQPSDGDRWWPVPDSWIWSRLGDLFEVNVGSTPTRTDKIAWSGDLPWVSSGEVSFRRIGRTREHIRDCCTGR